AYGEPTPITRRLLEDGEAHLLLERPIDLTCPVHLLHGQLDPVVPWQTALRLAAAITGGAVTVELIKDGDHRLSREEDLRRIAAALDRVLEQAGGDG
ncbi:MAG: alpha/beta hydrolase, partial [Geminicoccaceae bacterium]